MSNTMYYEAFNYLVPCKFIGWVHDELNDRYEARVKITRNKGCYKAGEYIDALAWNIVHKTRVINRCQYVCSAVLPPRVPENTIGAYCV